MVALQSPAAAAVLLLAVGVGLMLHSGDSAPEEQPLLARAQGLVRGGDGRGAARPLPARTRTRCAWSA